MSNKRSDRLNDIVLQTRRTGNTTWILSSTLKNPDCIIVARNNRYANELEREYYRRYFNKLSWWRKFLWKIRKRGQPKFVSLT